MKPGPGLAALAGLASFLIALACCLPLGTLALAVGIMGAGALTGSLRPYFMMLAVGLLAFGFWQSYRGQQCENRKQRVGILLLWTTAAIVFIMLLFPQAVASLLADWLTSGASR